MIRFALFIVLTVVASGQVIAQLTASFEDGGSVITSLGNNTSTNLLSTLTRTWIVINDNSAPASLEDVGVETKYTDQFLFETVGSLTAKEALSATEIRILLYDVFGNHLRTLSHSSIIDLSESAVIRGSPMLGMWPAYKIEPANYLTSVSFLAQARTVDGEIWRFNQESVRRVIEELGFPVDENTLLPSPTP